MTLCDRENTVIVYAGKYGSTLACAEYLKSGLTGRVTLADADKANLKDMDLEDYDTVILGSAIYIGAISKKMRRLCNESADFLLEKRVGIYLCCAFPEQAKAYLAANFPAALLAHAAVIKHFGGAASMDKMNCVERLIMKSAIKDNREGLKLSYENMDDFIREI